MTSRTAFVDDQLIARDFNTDDVVRKSGIRDFALSPYIGRVLYSNVETGKVQVQWPWGAEIETASELIRDASGYFAPSQADQSYSTWEGARNINSKPVQKAEKKFRKSLASSVVDAYEERTLPLWRAACEAWHCGMDEVETYFRMASVFGHEYGQEAVRLTVSNLYEHGRHIAIYWKNNKRRYKVTQREKSSGNIQCPRCKAQLKPGVYRAGKRVLRCNGCSFIIHPSDIVS
jgi:hypothetical protein